MYHDKENWKIIIKFNNYECSDLGKIRNKHTKRILKGNYEKSYLKIRLLDNNGIKQTKRIHRIIAETWLKNPDNKSTVDHINKKRDDNRVENLRWFTPKEQSGNINYGKRKINNTRKIWKCDVNTGNKIKLYNSAKEALLDLQNEIKYFHNISKCALGKIKEVYGFKWIYDDEFINLENEIWKSFLIIRKNNYFISNMGRIRNNNRILKPGDDNEGYQSISINKKYKYIHDIVAESFLENKNNYKVV